MILMSKPAIYRDLAYMSLCTLIGIFAVGSLAYRAAKDTNTAMAMSLTNQRIMQQQNNAILRSQDITNQYQSEILALVAKASNRNKK